jgi:murein DD-endopeptidase MepM/ murein hydrolase activator NlpD
MRVRSRALCLLAALALLPGCRPNTSAEYAEAHRLFSQLYATHLDAAYARPEMDRVVSLLQAVPDKSVDAVAARELLARIEAGRAQLAREEELRRNLLHDLLSVSVEDSDAKPTEGRRAALADAGEPDAGPPLDGGPRRRRAQWACTPSAFRVLLPFEARDTAFVSQGNGTRFTHQGASRFAFDFNVPIGTAIVAAAPGIVLQTQDTFDRSADMDPEQYNFVLVHHGNGVLTEYGHLRHHGTRVRPGQRVAQGELLGYSGDTGRSTGPHLHFAVEDVSLQSQPACFLDVESGVPQAGEVVKSGNLPGPEPSADVDVAAVPSTAFASQQIALESKLPLLLPNTEVEIEGRVEAPAREVVLWVRPQGARDPLRRLMAPVNADGRFQVRLPLEGLEGIQWIGFSRVHGRGAWKGWAVRRFCVAPESPLER